MVAHAVATVMVALYTSAAPDRKAGDNMNGDYTIATNVLPKASKPFSTRSADYAGGVEYFDVYSPVITSRYSEVFWTMMEAVTLPQDIVERFEGKVMAITGHEADQVFKSTTPGVPDVSVPITWAYNHHYGHYINGKNSVLEEVPLSKIGAREDMGHAVPGDKVWISRAKDDDSNPTSTIPTATVFATGNGGEFRKSFHSYPAPYAQLVESPSSWSIVPMQIDTRNRNGSMAKPGMPFVPGPYPTSANAPRYGPDAVYSGLLECPCTDRITRSLGTDSGKPVAKIDGTVCETEVPQQADCEKAAADLAAEVVLPAQQHHNSSGKCAYSEHKGAFLGGYAAGSSSAGWATLQEAQAWCCSNAAACGGVTYQSNSYTARQPGTLSKNPLEGLDTWVLSGGGSKPAVPFNFTSGSSSKEPAGCSITVGSAGVTGYFNTAPTTPVLCGGVPGARHVAGGGAAGKVALALQLSEAKNVVTITMTGPSNVWFGVGFNAQAMTDLPWAIVVDGITGKVSEHKLADQAPGIVLQPSVKIVSSSVTADSQRTVVMTRSIKMSDYESNYFNFDLATTSFPFITAVGAGPTFAYHKSHAVGNLAMFAQGGAPTCICAGDGVPFGKTPGGVIMYNATGTPEGASGSVGFGKDCVGSCDATHSKGCTQNSTLMQQKNPTCDVRTYKGGLSCCHHHYFLLDKNQSIPEDTMSYQMKARFYFQEYKPETHKQLYRWHWQTADGAGEYDITKCAPGTPPEECIHTLKARIRVSDFASGPCDPRSGLNSLTPACKAGSVGFKPIFLDGHCHAPTCLSMEMFNDDTGESICRTVPTYGTMKSNTTSGNARFEELGYLALPPCIWSENGGEDGLPEPPLLTWDANVSAIKTCNSTYYHTGEMARWQGHGVIV